MPPGPDHGPSGPGTGRDPGTMPYLAFADASFDLAPSPAVLTAVTT
jgi:hypothetical protein